MPLLQPDRNVRWRAKLKCPLDLNGGPLAEAVQVFLGRSRRRPVPRPVAWAPKARRRPAGSSPAGVGFGSGKANIGAKKSLTGQPWIKPGHDERDCA